MPFILSDSIEITPFKIIYYDIWTSTIQSISEISFYAIFFDHYSHFVWAYLLHAKSEAFYKATHMFKCN